jgi:hypothetical protein
MVVVATVCLAAVPALARQPHKQKLPVTLPGVDANGNLSSDMSLGVSTTFYFLLNTNTGQVAGVASGMVTNNSGTRHVYYDNSLLTGAGIVQGVTVVHDSYEVTGCGDASYAAIGVLSGSAWNGTNLRNALPKLPAPCCPCGPPP